MTVLLSESLVHVIFGAGLPSARHFSVMLPPSVTVWFPDISMMLGGTAKTNELAIWHRNSKAQILLASRVAVLA